MIVTTGGRFHILRGIWLDDQNIFNITFGHAFDLMAHFFANKFGRIGINGLILSGHDPHLHQRLDHVCRSFRHTISKGRNRDSFWDSNLAQTFSLRVVKIFFLRSFPWRAAVKPWSAPADFHLHLRLDEGSIFQNDGGFRYLCD